jgi:hypothetical protein
MVDLSLCVLWGVSQIANPVFQALPGISGLSWAPENQITAKQRPMY